MAGGDGWREEVSEACDEREGSEGVMADRASECSSRVISAAVSRIAVARRLTVAELSER